MKALARRPFAELSKMPERTPLKAPPEFNEHQFVIFRRPGDEGGVDIAVQRVVAYPEGDESRSGPSFEIFANGRIIDPFGLIERRRAAPESAPWFGATGLAKATERELPRYLRLELGESSSDPQSLKAADLKYVGVFREAEALVHYWRMPWGRKAVFAYVLESPEGSVMGWGDRKPKGK